MRTWRRAAAVGGAFGRKRERVIVTRAGRRFAIHGDFVADETIATTDVDLAARGRGAVDFITTEVLGAIDSRIARVVTTRREALDLLLQVGVITASEARKDLQCAYQPPANSTGIASTQKGQWTMTTDLT